MLSNFWGIILTISAPLFFIFDVLSVRTAVNSWRKERKEFKDAVNELDELHDYFHRARHPSRRDVFNNSLSGGIFKYRRRGVPKSTHRFTEHQISRRLAVRSGHREVHLAGP